MYSNSSFFGYFTPCAFQVYRNIFPSGWISQLFFCLDMKVGLSPRTGRWASSRLWKKKKKKKPSFQPKDCKGAPGARECGRVTLLFLSLLFPCFCLLRPSRWRRVPGSARVSDPLCAGSSLCIFLFMGYRLGWFKVTSNNPSGSRLCSAAGGALVPRFQVLSLAEHSPKPCALKPRGLTPRLRL